MPPFVALLLTAGFVIYLFRRDARQPSEVSGALWIPLLWVLITGTRFVSQWLGIWGVMGGARFDDSQEGSPLDAIVFMLLIAAGFMVLKRRRVKLATLARKNTWLTIFFVYCFLAIVWSDFPFIALKRWIKILGHPIMALVILTEADPYEALRRLFRRAAFVMISGSVLCIKYFPEIGRGFDSWGISQNRGLNINKNELGYVCMIMGFFFAWDFLQTRFLAGKKARRDERVLCVGFLAMIVWLLHMANSITSLICAVVGISMMLVLAADWINKKYLGSYIIAAVLIFGLAESTLGVYEKTIKALGRNPTLTDRTEVWGDVFAAVEDPILGAGFESFWLGERLEKLWAKWWWRPTQAHNGYIETYLNLGLVGAALLIALVVGTFSKIKKVLLTDFQMGRLRMGFLVAILIYNFTEAAFKGVHLVWFVFHLVAMDYPRIKTRLRKPLAQAPGTEAVSPML